MCKTGLREALDLQSIFTKLTHIILRIFNLTAIVTREWLKMALFFSVFFFSFSLLLFPFVKKRIENGFPRSLNTNSSISYSTRRRSCRITCSFSAERLRTFFLWLTMLHSCHVDGVVQTKLAFYGGLEEKQIKKMKSNLVTIGEKRGISHYKIEYTNTTPKKSMQIVINTVHPSE